MCCAWQWHPDKNPKNVEEATKRFSRCFLIHSCLFALFHVCPPARFIEISNAYEVLSDEDTRKDYDYFLDHPEEQMTNQYRYYRTRMAKKVDIRAVLAGLVIVTTILQLTLQRQGREHNINRFKSTKDFQQRLNEKISASKTKQQAKKKKISNEDKVRARLALEDQLIEELDREFGLFPRVSWRQTIIPQLICSPWTIYQEIKSQRERAKLDAERAEEDRLQKLQEEKEDAEKRSLEQAR